MVDGGGVGEGGGFYPIKCGRPDESLNSNEKMSKFTKTGLLRMLDMSPYLIVSYISSQPTQTHHD